MTAGHTTRHIFLAVAFTFIFHMTEGGQLCGICTQMVDPRDCDVVGECGDHEECSISQYASPTGHILYDMGCESSLACRSSTGRRNSDVSRTSQLVGAGNVVICSTCCNDTQICNVINGHCSSQALDLTGAIICYNCDYMHSPDQCDRVRVCSVHEQCYIGAKQSPISGSWLWTSRCGHSSVDCQGSFPHIPVDGVVGKRQFPAIRSGCCKDNFCNHKNPSTFIPQHITKPPTTTTTVTSSTSNMTKPVITYVTRLHDVKKGSDIHLTCRATGNPTPTISWNVFTSGSLPPNLRVENGGTDLYIDRITDNNYGNYACSASNPVGTDTAYVDILEHGPVLTRAK